MLLAVFSMVGCAASTSARNGGGFCTIDEAPWPSAPSAFDRRLTLEVIGGLRQSVEADIRALAEGRRNEIGDRLTAISHQPATSAFISVGVAELATRLRQLACAVRAQRVSPEIAQQRYGSILGELRIEQATLEPKGGASTSQRRAVIDP
jgi:hypothetical protein